MVKVLLRKKNGSENLERDECGWRVQGKETPLWAGAPPEKQSPRWDETVTGFGGKTRSGREPEKKEYLRTIWQIYIIH